MSSHNELYQFDIDNNRLTAIREWENGRWEKESLEPNTTYSILGKQVKAVEYKSGGEAKTTLYQDRGDGIYSIISRTDTPVSHSQNRYAVNDKTLPWLTNEQQLTLLYHAAFNRAPDSAGIQYWSAQMEHSHFELDDVAERFMKSSEFQRLYGSNLSEHNFIEALYHNTLGRTSDANGKAYWLNQLAQGEDRGDVLEAFSLSKEHISLILSDVSDLGLAIGDNHNKITLASLSNIDQITLLYHAVFNRAPDNEGLIHWTNLMDQQEMDVDDVAEQLLKSEEYLVRYSLQLSDNDFIDMLYQNTLRRPADAAGKQYWLNQLVQGEDRDDVVEAFALSAEHVELVLPETTVVDSLL